MEGKGVVVKGKMCVAVAWEGLDDKPMSALPPHQTSLTLTSFHDFEECHHQPLPTMTPMSSSPPPSSLFSLSSLAEHTIVNGKTKVYFCLFWLIIVKVKLLAFKSGGIFYTIDFSLLNPSL